MFEGNIAYGKKLSNTSLPAGITNIDPLLKASNGGLFHITAKSPAINNAVVSDVKDDFAGIIRDDKKDIGAEEFSVAKPLRHPLTASEVGPNWMIKK